MRFGFLINVKTEHTRQSPDFNLGVQIDVPQSNQPLNFCESDFPEIDLNGRVFINSVNWRLVGNHGYANNVGADGIGEMVAEFDSLSVANSCEGKFLFFLFLS